MTNDLALRLRDVNKKFRVYSDRPSSLKQLFSARARLRYHDTWVLRDVSLDLAAGTTLGIVGHNGSGKSTLLRIMGGIYKPSSGSVSARGQVAALMELGAGFHPELTGRDNVYLNGALMGLSRRQIRERFDHIVEFAGVEEFIDTPVKHYSSGMYVRLGFSVAVNVDADIILIDEVIAVGDAEFQQRCKEHIKGLATSGRTVVLVSHVLADIKDLSDQVIWLDHGKIIAAGDPSEVTDEYVRAAREHSLPVHDPTRPAAIQSISLLDRSGGPVLRAAAGEPLTIRVSYRTTVRVERPIFRITVDHVTGTPLSGTNSGFEPLEIESIEGDGHVDYEIERLPFVPGTYLVSAWMYEKRTSDLRDAMERSFVLEVEPGPSPIRYGLIDLNGRWKTGD